MSDNDKLILDFDEVIEENSEISCRAREAFKGFLDCFSYVETDNPVYQAFFNHERCVVDDIDKKIELMLKNKGNVRCFDNHEEREDGKKYINCEYDNAINDVLHFLLSYKYECTTPESLTYITKNASEQFAV